MEIIAGARQTRIRPGSKGRRRAGFFCLLKLQVRHVNRECLGAKVIEISDDGTILCRQFLEEQRAANPS